MVSDEAFTTRRSRRPSLDSVATIMFIALCAAAIWALLFGRPAAPPTVVAAGQPARLPPGDPPPEPPLPAEPVSIDGAAVRGSQAAKVVLIEYSDFQCPFCGKFARETLPELERQYIASGKVRLAFRHLPLAQIHPFAQKAAEAAACAGRQNAFWPMHDRLFQDQTHLDDASLQGRATSLGLNLTQFTMCLGAGQASSDVQRDSASASALRISGTPTFFVGTSLSDGRVKVASRLGGAQPIAKFQVVLDRILAQTR